MPILLAFFKSCAYNVALAVSKSLAAAFPIQHHHSRLARRTPPVMPDVDDPSRMARKGKEAPIAPGLQHAKHVRFEPNGGNGGSSTATQYPPPPQATSAPNSPSSSKTQAAAAAAAAGTPLPPSKSREQASQAASSPPAVDNQPTSFPQVGAPPGQFGPGHWYTSADPRMSLSQPQQYQQLPSNGGVMGGGFWSQPGVVPLFANGAPAGTHFYPAAVSPHFAALNNICHPSSVFIPGTAAAATAAAPDSNIMANYQNAGPPNSGVNFQPPVPDTTFGPIPHVYIPRFDATHASGHPQPAYSTVPVGQPGFVVAQQPVMIPQPMTAPGQQPVFLAGQAPPGFIQTAATAPPQVIMGGGGGGGGGIPVIAGNSGFPPDVSGLGRTQGEEMLRQLQFAHANKLFEPQEFKPADDDPSRFYYVREVDGNWTQRNRFTIDHMGDCRWYVTDEGWFYAVRLPD
ncbi:hypothetical protein IF1G_08557 [Cordyceps javanica]|uniref:Uncharacterized protein n=1 Tax=Cordyceps javanica TaxID=43265 RepID=A0A545VP01_9HYPO|nr:hypothetical protein IF1G_08557 [Cordyceps javanica]TQW03406.1 hypothetical protein IF2G_09135 [Cordyceps javanica]